MKKLIALAFIPLVLWAQEMPQPGPHLLKDPDRYFRPDGPDAVSDRAVGLLDKGQLSNLMTNYGILADFHLGNPALHWPRSGSDVQHYGFGVSLILIADEQVVTSIYDQSSAALDFGWEAWDGSLGGLYNDARTEYNTAGDGVTPFLAFSDIRDTWPVIDGVPTWPGYFRENLQNPGEVVPGEFTSDRDVFCTLQDDYGMGLRVHQTAYCYGRYYAEDAILVRFTLFNDGDTYYEDCYVGFQADLKPDFYADDYIGYWDMIEGNSNPDFFYKWDGNGIAQRDDSSHFEDLWVGPVGTLGMGMIETPDDLGVTSFHYYHDDWSPVEREYFLPILTNDPTSPLENIEEYFHGEDIAFDDPSLWTEVDKDTLPGAEITFSFGSGPFSLAPGDSVNFSIVFAIGEDEDELRENVETAYFMAEDLYYQGSGPPAVPHLTAIPGDGVVHLYWDNRAESSIDAISGEMDFEGYRLFKSTDMGETWGDPITNFLGDQVGWVPLVQYDLADSVTGSDPAYGPDFPDANSWLGDDTGLRHSYSDYDVVNGQAVWYSISAYDRGVYDPENPAYTEPSYQNVIGASQYDQNVVAVVPGTQSVNQTPGIGLQPVEINGGVADGTLEVVVTNHEDLLEHTYRITFNPPGDTAFVGQDTIVHDVTSLNLEDVTAGSDVFIDQLTGDEFQFTHFPLSGDDLPIVNGFRLVAQDVEGFGIRSLEWTTVMNEESTFDWWTENRHPGNQSAYEEIVEGTDDWRITITDEMAVVSVIAAGFGIEPEDSTISVPLQIERAGNSTGGEWVDATEFLQISDLQLAFTGSPSLGPYGWDLIPGGAGYNPDPNLGTLWPDILVLRDDANDTTGSLLYLLTQNGPAGTIPPSVGDVFTILTNKPFTEDLIYEFSTQTTSYAKSDIDLSKIKVVPNPFIVSSGLESNPYESRVMFTHLPSECEINIYTVAANRVKTLNHSSSSGEGFTFWDLTNDQGQNVAYGVYVYVVKTPKGEATTGKLMVIR